MISLLVIALVGVFLFLAFSSMQGGGISPAAGTDKATSAAPVLSASKAAEDARDIEWAKAIKAGNVIMNAGGYIVADSLWDGRPVLSQKAQTSNILKKEGERTPITQNYMNDPLLTAYKVSTGEQFIAYKPPASAAEATASRLANIADLASRGVTVNTGISPTATNISAASGGRIATSTSTASAGQQFVTAAGVVRTK